MAETWSNWSGSVTFRPRRIERPASEAELARVVRRAASEGLGVRVYGTGHSFTPLVETDAVLVSLDALAGVQSADPAAREATVLAGTKLSDLGAPLLERGLALENQGDVDVQSLGGALGTGTHGTGKSLGNLSTHPVMLRLVTASGETVECSAERDPELFRAARLSLGALGVISAARLRLCAAYRLHERVWREPIEQALPLVQQRIDESRHFEFFWFPRQDVAELKSLQPTHAEPSSIEGVEGERIGWSADIISSVREQRFNEMEYALPARDGLECFREVRERLRTRHPDVVWPVEYRSLAADDAYLSPAFARDTITISVHQDARLPFRELFSDVEAIFRGYAGRPHWGKIHTRSADELRRLYPEWETFQAVRRRLDPDGRFLSPYLRQLFGEC
jgi:FAD/FMN-containing dehydrogenase